MRKNQLVLIERSEADFHLDERTREMGRLGVAAAREALRRAQSSQQQKAA
jgi:hypothetical protein